MKDPELYIKNISKNLILVRDPLSQKTTQKYDLFLWHVQWGIKPSAAISE
jgi:hypothetical protein